MKSLLSNFKFSSLTQAQVLLTTEDQFSQSWSQFDIDSRVGRSGSSKKDLFEKIKTQALEWNEEETKTLQNIIRHLDETLQKQGFNLPLAQDIPLIKSTMQEEGGAMGYTRGNYIVLNESVCSKPEAYIQKLLIHELFHVLTRNNPAFRKALYQIIGFEMMSAIPYPESLQHLRITNPDAPQTDSFIRLKIGDTSVPCMMILYANKPYEVGRFFDYLQTGFLQLTPDLTGPILQNERPVIHTIEEVSNFFEQVGRNTNYIIHPEEILADNFAYTILEKEDIPDAWLIEKITTILKSI